MAISFIFLDSHEMNYSKTNKVADINSNEKIYSGVIITVADKNVSQIKSEGGEIESDKPLFSKRVKNETNPGSPDLRAFINSKIEHIPAQDEVENYSKQELMNNESPDFNSMAELQNGVEVENDEFLRTPYNPMTEFYFISAFIYYMPFYSRFSRLTLMILSILTQALLSGVLILLWDSGVSESAVYSMSEIFDRLNATHLLYAMSTPVVSNLFVAGLECLIIKRRSNNKTDLAEAVKQQNCSKNLRLFGLLISLCIIGLMVLATYYIVVEIDGNSSMIWMSMIIIALIFDIAFVQVARVMIGWSVNSIKNKDIK